jgi:hypothetical protein
MSTAVASIATVSPVGAMVSTLGVACSTTAGRLPIHAIKLASANPNTNGITREVIAFAVVGGSTAAHADEVVMETPVPSCAVSNRGSGLSTHPALQNLYATSASNARPMAVGNEFHSPAGLVQHFALKAESPVRRRLERLLHRE